MQLHVVFCLDLTGLELAFLVLALTTAACSAASACAISSWLAAGWSTGAFDPSVLTARVNLEISVPAICRKASMAALALLIRLSEPRDLLRMLVMPDNSITG